MNYGAVRLLRRSFDGGEVFVYGVVKGFELLFRQALLILIADVNARFLEGIDQCGIGSNVRHGLDENLPDFSVAGFPFGLGEFSWHCKQNITQTRHGEARRTEGICSPFLILPRGRRGGDGSSHAA